jgi:hypothetical protein
MSFSKIAEEKIRDAMSRGEFDNLEGKGKPIDHAPYFAAPPDVRLGHQMLKSNGFVPEEVVLLKEAAALKERARAETDAEKALALRRALNDRLLKLDLLREARKGRSRRPRM